MNSGGSSLRYSGDRIQEPATNEKDWQQFGNEDIDYSDLDSIKDQSMQEWDISKMQKVRKKSQSHSKTIEGLYEQLSSQNDNSP